MTSEDWRTELARAVADATAAAGPAAVRAALEAETEALPVDPDAQVEPWCPPVAILATTGCETGRLGVLLHPDGRVTVHLAKSQDVLLEQVHTVAEEGFLLADEGAETAAGDQDRDELRRSGIVVPAWFSGSGFTEDDLLRACSVLLTARR